MKTIDHIASQNSVFRALLDDYRNHLKDWPFPEMLAYLHGRATGALLVLYSAGLISEQEHDSAREELLEMAKGVEQ